MSDPDIPTMGDLDRLAMAASMVPVKLDAADFGMTHDGAKAVVRAVLQALREPTDELIHVGVDHYEGIGGGCNPLRLRWAITGIIDHILSEPTP